jgi:hypothetical protein
MFAPPTINDWARKLIALEAQADTSSEQTELVTLRVYEKLRRQFCAPVGVDAFQALASRALSLTKSQFPGLSVVSVEANGGLRGLGEIESSFSTLADGEAGITLIGQMLRLFISLLGEAATVRLIEDASLRRDLKGGVDTASVHSSGSGANYLGPFEGISLEADQLRHVSERLETLADTYADVDELMGVAGNIRNIATALDVFTLVRSKGGASRDSVLSPPTNGYMN